MKQILFIFYLSFFFITAIGSQAFAQTTPQLTPKGVRITNKVEIRITQAVGRIKAKVRGAIGTGTVTLINGTTLTVDKNGTTYTVLTGEFEKCTTRFRRRFWGASTIAEIKAGHIIHVTGRWTDDTKTTIEACTIRDISIQKRFGVFVGEIVSVSSTGFTMTTVSEKRGNQTVITDSNTKFVNRRNQALTGGLSDVKVGHRIRVKGLWDRSDNTITQVNQVKDFSLPPLPTKKLSPTAARAT